MTRTPKIGIAVLVALVAIQLVPVSRTNPPERGPIETPADVRVVLERSCYDCHSNQTAWPWYSRVAPASWLVARDVNRARDELNFSEWAGYSESRRDEKLEDLEEVIDEREMPLPIYLRLHSEARLSDVERGLLISWARGQRENGSVGAE
jgi:hypothetical protein